MPTDSSHSTLVTDILAGIVVPTWQMWKLRSERWNDLLNVTQLVKGRAMSHGYPRISAIAPFAQCHPHHSGPRSFFFPEPLRHQLMYECGEVTFPCWALAEGLNDLQAPFHLCLSLALSELSVLLQVSMCLSLTSTVNNNKNNTREHYWACSVSQDCAGQFIMYHLISSQEPHAQEPYCHLEFIDKETEP